MKRLEIEWKHLDQGGQTCERCAATGDTVRLLARELSKELEPRGWKVSLRETRLGGDDISQSNQVLFNGVPLEEILPRARKAESCCASCEDLLGLPTLCRTIEYQGKTYEAIPPQLIREAVYQIIDQP